MRAQRRDGDAWSDERTAALHRLFRAGLNDEEIAERLGVTTRAVIGKRDRENLMRAQRVGPRGRPCSSATA